MSVRRATPSLPKREEKKNPKDFSSDQELRILEKYLLGPRARKSPEKLMALLAPEFQEIGSRGDIYNRKDIIDALKLEEDVEWSLDNFKVSSLSQDVALVNYRAQKKMDRKYRGRYEAQSGY